MVLIIAIKCTAEGVIELRLFQISVASDTLWSQHLNFSFRQLEFGFTTQSWGSPFLGMCTLDSPHSNAAFTLCRSCREYHFIINALHVNIQVIIMTGKHNISKLSLNDKEAKVCVST